MTLQRFFYIVLAFIVLGVQVFGQHRLLDRTVAVVDREIILQSELNSQVDFFVFNNRVDPNMPNLKRDVLEAMINEKLILAKAVQDTITVSDDEVAQQLDALIQQRVAQVGSEKRLEELYGMPMSRMKREFREEMRKQMMANRLQQTKFADVQATRREVADFFAAYKDSLPQVPEEVELYHVFRIPQAGEDAKAAIRAKGKLVLDSIKAGGDFADFARRYSQDPGSATSGGDLHFIRRGQLVKEFEEVVFGMKEGEISNLVETSFGYHIIQLLERRGESVHARHILFKIERDSTAEQRTLTFLSTLRDSALAGTNFTDLAKRHSQDTETGPIGGFLGVFTLDQLSDAELTAAIEKMQQGDISEPLRVQYGTSFGYHIVFLKKRAPTHAMNMQDDARRIEQAATNLKRNREYQKWISELKKDIYWEIRL